jgi:hypothetical protein
MTLQTSTFFALLAEFNTATIELSVACKKYFGLTPPEAAKRANLNKLPIPAFRCGTQKAAWMIHAEDLANHIDNQRQNARSEWQKMNK